MAANVDDFYTYKRVLKEGLTAEQRVEAFRLRGIENKAREFYKYTAHCPKCWRGVNLGNHQLTSGSLYLFGHTVESMTTRPVDQRCRQCRGIWFRWSAKDGALVP